MKRLVTAVLLISMGAIAEEAAKIEEPTEAKVEESGGHKDWPSLDEWADNNKLKSGTLTAEILLGYEYSDLSDNGTQAAHAVLTRTRLNYQTANFEGFDARVQAQYVGPINDHYGLPGGGGNPNYDVVADPEAFRLHQAYLAYTGYDTHGRVGPQEIILDNARFIGNVGWRFNAQSFNAGSVKNESVENLKLYYAYADSINEIDGDTNHDRQYHMLNGEYKLGENNNVSGLIYLQRNDGGGLEKLDTYGLRAWGKNEKISHDAMIALQRDAFYGSLFGEFDMDAVDVGAGVEYISGGQGGEQFQTLNGTAHKFNGWADQFLGTGGGLPGGLIDVYGQVSSTVIEKLKLMGVVHYFNTTDTTAGFDGTYGYEIDALAKYPVCKNFDVLAKVAYYIKDGNVTANTTADETVFWLRGTLSF